MPIAANVHALSSESLEQMDGIYDMITKSAFSFLLYVISQGQDLFLFWQLLTGHYALSRLKHLHESAANDFYKVSSA